MTYTGSSVGQLVWHPPSQSALVCSGTELAVIQLVRDETMYGNFVKRRHCFWDHFSRILQLFTTPHGCRVMCFVPVQHRMLVLAI